MSIYDREYVRFGKKAPSGLGGVRFWSFNTWLIVINVAVFVIDALLASSGVMFNVNVGTAWAPTADKAQKSRAVATPVLAPVGLPGASGRLVVDSRGKNLAGTHTFGDARYADGKAWLIIDNEPFEIIGRNRVIRMAPLQALFHFSSGKLFHGLEFWRLIGFQFLHAGVEHLFFNMIGLFFFGGLVEGWLGPKRYAAFYLTCGIFGGVAYLLLNLLGQYFKGAPFLLIHDPYTPLIGASAGVFGVLMASAHIAPNAQVLLFFLIPMRLRTVAYGFTLLAALRLFTGASNAGGEAAHLGGAMAGYYFIRHTHLLRDFFEILGPKRRAGATPPPSQRRTGEEAEVDRILSKVRAGGLHSLTERERRALRRATEAARSR